MINVDVSKKSFVFIVHIQVIQLVKSLLINIDVAELLSVVFNVDIANGSSGTVLDVKLRDLILLVFRDVNLRHIELLSSDINLR